MHHQDERENTQRASAPTVQNNQQLSLVLKQRLDAVINHINNGVAASVQKDDGSVEYVFVTDKYYEMLGYTRDSYHREVTDPYSLIDARDIGDVRMQVSSLKRAGDSARLRYRANKRDGGLIWLDVSITLMSFADVDRPVLLSVFTDVTHMVEVNEQLAQQSDRMHAVLSTTPGGIAIIEVDPTDIAGTMRTVYYNDSFFSYSGYSRDEYDTLLRNDEMHFVFDEDKPALLSSTLEMCSGEVNGKASVTVRCHTKGGGYRWLLLTGQLVSRHGDLCVINIVMVDVTTLKEAEDKQRINEDMLRIAAETDKRAIVIYNVKVNSCRVESRMLNSAAFGDVFVNVPQSLLDAGIVSAETDDELRALFERINQGEQHAVASLLMHVGNQTYQWFECNATTVFDSDGQPDHAVLVFHNITEQRLKEAVFKKWQQSITQRPPETYTLFRCNLSRDASLDEQDGKLLRVSFGTEVTSFNQRTREYAEQYVCPQDREAYEALLNSDALLAMFYRGKHTAEMEYREINAEGALLWRHLTIEMVEYLHSNDVQAFLMYEDINEKKLAELRERELAQTDPLTGALNRVAFSRQADDIVAKAPNAQHAMIMMDIDGFKLLNDRFGHAAGDQALVDMTAVLRALIHEGDLLCRLGGDEFLIWLRDVPYDAVIEKTVKQISQQVRKAFSVEVQITASLGIAVYPRDGQDFDTLYHRADNALYQVKQTGKDNYAFFSAPKQSGEGKAEQPDTRARSASPLPKKTKRRMLIVDDSETNRLMLRAMFEDEYLIETVQNGVDAMIRLRHFGSSVAVVLLDLVMPQMDGFEVLKRIRDDVDLRAIPVIVVSGDDSHETLLRAIECGAADFVTKPVDKELMRIRVRSVVSKAENERLRAQNSYLQLQRDEEMKFHTVLESTGTVVIEYNWHNHVFLYDNTITNHIRGRYDQRGLWKIFLLDMVADSADVKSMQEAVLRLADDHKADRVTKLVLLATPSGAKHWFRMNVYKKTDAFGLADKMVITFNDVHDEVLARERLLYQATRDELTGLYSRAGFIQKAEEMIRAKEPGYYVMSCMDIERFKVINDQYGTAKGDEVLKHLAQTLLMVNQGKDTVCCRVMADQFAILYPKKLLETGDLARLNHRAEQPDDTLPQLKVCVGRCAVDDPTLDISAIYDRATLAKETVKGRYDAYAATYSESMRTALLRSQRITSEMKSALEGNQFEVWLQPQFNHATGNLAGAEALVRWRHPVDGIVSPGEFIPIFEANGFIYELDQFVWETTCRLLRKWLDMGLKPMPVSVNVSRYDVFRDDLIDVFKALLERYSLPVSLLHLEITESAFSQSTRQIISVVERLVGMGFIVEIDDFGSGYSSLNTLKDVPAQVLKMDMRFLENDNNAQRGGSIIESVVRMSRWLGMSVIAEGVETLEQANYLKSIGCTHVQGYLYSKPIEEVAYESLIAGGGIETEREPVKKVETWNNNAFWNPKSMETLIFNSYVGGACIFEYHCGQTELLRTNTEYESIFKDVRKVSGTLQGLFTLTDENNGAPMKQAIQEAIATKAASTCEVRLIKTDGSPLYIRVTLRQIAGTEDRDLFYCVVTDVTAQRMAVRKEREAASRIAAVMDNVDGGITAVCVHDGKPEIIFSNDRYYTQLGYTREQFGQEVPTYYDVIHPDDRSAVWQKVRHTLETRASSSMEYRSVKRDGSIIHIRSNIALCRIDGIDGDVMITVETDISELVSAVRANQQASAQLQVIMENVNGGVAAGIVRDGVIRYLFTNNRYDELMGFKKGAHGAAGERFGKALDAVHPDDRALVNASIRRALTERMPDSVEFRLVGKDGRVRWVYCNIVIVRLPDVQQPVHLACVNDTTKLHETQRLQTEAAQRVRAIMENATCGITAVVLHDNKTVEYILVNDMYYRLVGYTREQYAQEGLQGLELMHPDDLKEYGKQIISLNTVGQSLSFEFRARRRDGRWVWLRDDITVISLEGINAPVQLSCFTDITAEKEAGLQLHTLNDLAHDILAQPDSEKAIRDTLRKLMAYHGADRGCISEFDAEKAVGAFTYQVYADGSKRRARRARAISFNLTDEWYQTLQSNAFYVLENVDELPESQTAIKSVLKAQGISSVILSPLWRDGRLIGFVGVSNPTKATQQSQWLKAVGDYIAVLLTRRDLGRDVEQGNAAIRQLIDDTPGGFCRMRIQTGRPPSLVSVNEGFCRMLGMTAAEVMTEYGENMYRCFAQEDVDMSLAQARQARQNLSQYSVRCRLRKKDGAYMPVMAFGRFISDAAGDTYLNAFFTDMTEQKRAEEMQIKLLDNLACGVALYEYDGARVSVIHINKNYWKLIGREPADYSRASVLDVVHPDDKASVIQELISCIRHNRDFSADFRVLNGQGGYTPFHVTATVEKEQDGKYLIYAAYSLISDSEMSFQEMLPVALATVMSSSEDITCLKDTDGRYIACSKSAVPLFGLESEQSVVGKLCGDLLDKRVAAQIAKLDDTVIATGQPMPEQAVKLPRGKNKQLLLSMSKYPLLDGRGRVIGIYTVCRDVTRAKNTEFELKTLLRVIPSGVLKYAADESTAFAYVNRSFIENLGYTQEQFKEKFHNRFREMVWADDRERVEREIFTQEDGGRIGHIDYRVQAADGQLRWFHDEGVKVTDEDGQTWYYVTLMDVTEQKETMLKLRFAEEEYRLATFHSHATTCRYDIAKMTVTINSEVAKRLELPDTIEDVPYGRVKAGRISPDTAQAYIAFFERIIHGEKESDATFQKLLPSGWRWISAHATTLFDHDGKAVSAVISYVDVTDQQEKEAVYKRWQQRLLNKGGDAFTLYRCNLNKNCSYDSAEGQLIPFRTTHGQDKTFNDRTLDFAKQCVYPDDRAAYVEFVNSERMLAAYYRGKRAAEIEFRGKVASGEMHWLRLSIELVEYPNSTDVEAYLMYEDINDRRVRELQTQHEAETDPLTGLLNRGAFIRRFAERTAQAGALCALFMLDMDGFKLINDTHGHAAGDRVLVDMADAFRAALRKDDLVCRFGGDEFIIGVFDLPDREAILAIARQLCAIACKAQTTDIRMSASLGIAVCPDDGRAFDELYQKADKALYYVKEHGKDDCAFYVEAMRQSAGEHEEHAVPLSGGASDAKKRVLIVGIEPSSQPSPASVLQSDYDVVTVQSGAEAFIDLRRHSTETALVLLSLKLPDMDGMEALEKIKGSAELQQLPVIAVSDAEEREQYLRAIRCGASEYVAKPVDADLLRARAAAAIGRADNERLVMRNRALRAQQFESERLRAMLESNGAYITEYYPQSGTFRYSAALTRNIAGTYDDRPLWDILSQDNLLTDQQAELLRALAKGESAENGAGRTTLRLKTASGDVHAFRVKAVTRDDAAHNEAQRLLVFIDTDML